MVDSIFFYENEYDYKFDILMREFQIDMMQINDEYIYESQIYDLSLTMFESENPPSENGSKFLSAIRKIFMRIKRFITDFISMIDDVLTGGKKNITPEEYFEDPNVKVQIEGDVNKINAIVDDEILKGRKFVQALSRGTNIDDRIIANWVDSGAQKLDKCGKPLLIALGTVLTSALLFKKTNKNRESKIDSLSTVAENIKNPALQKKAVRVVNHISWLNNKSIQKQKEHVGILSKFKKKVADYKNNKEEEITIKNKERAKSLKSFNDEVDKILKKKDKHKNLDEISEIRKAIEKEVEKAIKNGGVTSEEGKKRLKELENKINKELNTSTKKNKQRIFGNKPIEL